MVLSQADSLGNTGHLSALDATSVTHSIRLDWSHTHNPSFRTTNEKYGQRLPLEQVANVLNMESACLIRCDNAMQCSAIQFIASQTKAACCLLLATWMML